MKQILRILPFTLVILLSYWAIQPLLVSGFFPIHDDTQVGRVYEMRKALLDGMFPVRWSTDLGYGYGYPIFNFYAPFAYYVGGIINLLGVDSLLATKLMIAIAILFSGVTMYLLAKEFWGRIGGIVSALCYIYVPYHALDVYVRGDVTETYAYAFIPLIFYGFWKLYKEKKWRYILVSSISFAALIISHNLTAFMVTPYIIAFLVFLLVISQKDERKTISFNFIIPVIIAFMLSAFYWLPVFTEIHYTNVLSQLGGGFDFHKHFVCLNQLWDSPWGYGGSAPGCIDGLSFKIGKPYLIFSVLALIVSLFIKKIEKQKLYVLYFALLALIISTFLTLQISQGIWEIVPFMNFLQFPWRFLLMIGFFTSFNIGSLCTFIVIFISQKQKKILELIAAGILIVLIILFDTKLFKPQFITHKTSSDYTNSIYLKWNTSAMTNEYMPKGFTIPQNKNEIPASAFFIEKGTGTINPLTQKTQEVSARVTTQQDSALHINIAYFPSWHVFLDTQEQKITILPNGFRITVPQGIHRVDVKFVQTPFERIGNLLTFAGIITLIIGIITSRKKYNL